MNPSKNAVICVRPILNSILAFRVPQDKRSDLAQPDHPWDQGYKSGLLTTRPSGLATLVRCLGRSSRAARLRRLTRSDVQSDEVGGRGEEV